jgi:hypothetical protein
MYSNAQMQKAEKQRKSINTFLVLSPELEFDTINAQMLEKISESLKPKTIALEHYSITWTIPRTQLEASSMPLSSPTDYQFLLDLALKQKNPSVNLVIKTRLLKNYCAILLMKSARSISFLSSAIFFSFLREMPARASSR